MVRYNCPLATPSDHSPGVAGARIAWLLDAAEARAGGIGVGEARLYTHALMTENLAIYTARGYRETHRDTAHGRHRVHLAKPLGPDPAQGSERTSR